jgi:hypothetical protein
MMTDYHGKTKEWINLFISLRDKINGYKKANITPYMHIMVYHIPKFFELYKTVKVFTGQGIERNNDVARNIVKFLKRSLIVNLLEHKLSTASLQSSTGKVILNHINYSTDIATRTVVYNYNDMQYNNEKFRLRKL